MPEKLEVTCTRYVGYFDRFDEGDPIFIVSETLKPWPDAEPFEPSKADEAWVPRNLIADDILIALRSGHIVYMEVLKMLVPVSIELINLRFPYMDQDAFRNEGYPELRYRAIQALLEAASA